MEKLFLLVFGFMMISAVQAVAQQKFEEDTFKTSAGDLKITFIGHGSLMFTFGGKIIHVDPYSGVADYTKLPKADMILLCHEHMDHLDPKALGAVRTEKSVLVLTETVAKQIQGGIVMKNGDVKTIEGLKIEAVPAYNIVHKTPQGQIFHPKGIGNGYVITFGDKRIYVAGDTENIPEMKNIKNIDIAFLPMNLPYTMTPEMVADAAKTLKPKILYPYHYYHGETDISKFSGFMKGMKEIEVRIRKTK